MKKDLRKNLEILAVAHAYGKISNDTLIKACENYKIQSDFVDDFDYNLCVSKSLYDALNGIEPDLEICKAVIPGQTKMIDGVMHIYSATKSGSKTQYAWHIVDKGAKTNQPIGRGSKLSKQQIDAKQKFANELFPSTPDGLKFIKQLNGSTKPELVEDASGNQYVLKKGSNTNPEHVKSEYIANQLYNVLGLRTPDFELYDDGKGGLTTLSRYIQGARTIQPSDYGKLAEGFMVDVLLANWDVFQNSDNCLIDASGRAIRVDNGGSLKYRAQGKLKSIPFDGNVLATFESMKKYNPGVSNLLNGDDFIKQIDDIIAKKDDVVNFLTESGEDDLAQILSERIDNLTKIKDEIQLEAMQAQARQNARLGKVKARNLKPEQEMYRTFTKKELDDIWKDALSKNSNNVSDALTNKDANGWALLQEICKKRGFDARPRVVTEKEFWKEREKSQHPIMARGVDGNARHNAEYYADAFLFSDNCYYGSYGVWGQGIYAHTDDLNTKWSYGKAYDPNDNLDVKTSEKGFLSSQIYKDAKGYGEAVTKMTWEADADIIDLDDLLADIKKNPPAISPQLKKLQTELAQAKDEWNQNILKVRNIADTVKKQVYSDIGYSEDTTKEVYDDIDNTDWGKRDIQGKLSYPKFDDFVLGRIKRWVESNNGTFEYDTQWEQAKITLRGNTILISKSSWENNAIKRKNNMTKPYHFQAERFKNFYDVNAVKPAANAVKAEMNKSDGMVKKIQEEANKSEQSYYKKKIEYDTALNASGTNDTMIGAIYNTVKNLDPRDSGNHSMSVVGIYAALQGYDGIYVHNGNGGNHGFNVILNRSKIVASIG